MISDRLKNLISGQMQEFYKQQFNQLFKRVCKSGYEPIIDSLDQIDSLLFSLERDGDIDQITAEIFQQTIGLIYQKMLKRNRCLARILRKISYLLQGISIEYVQESVLELERIQILTLKELAKFEGQQDDQILIQSTTKL